MKKRVLTFLTMLVMCICMLPSVVFADNANASGDVVRAYLNANSKRITVDMYNVQFAESVELKLYSGSELLTVSALDTAEFGAGSYGELTGSIRMEATPDSTWKTEAWEPVDGVVPTHVALCVDGTEVDTQELVVITAPETYRAVNAEDWAAFPGTVGGEIKNAFLADYKGGRIISNLINVDFKSSVEVRLYSGEKLLTTSHLNTTEYAPGNYGGFTAAVCIGGTSSSWTADEWLPMDEVVPTHIELVIDGKAVSTCAEIGYAEGHTTLTQEQWAAFPGTYKNDFNGIWMDTYGGGRVAFELSEIAYEESMVIEMYSGNQLLTATKMDTTAYGPGKYSAFTGSLFLSRGNSSVWLQDNWVALDSVVPTELRLIIDGVVTDVDKFNYSADKWAKQENTLGADAVRAYLNESANWITVDMYTVDFNESLTLKLYSGEELLTTSSIDTTEYGPSFYGEFTGSIAMEASPDSTWITEDWTPVEAKVPTHVTVCVDGIDVDTQELVVITAPETYRAVNAEDWKAFPGTVGINVIRAYLNASKSRITVDMDAVEFYESVALQLYSGEKLLTTANLDTTVVAPGQKSELTGVIGILDSGSAWPQEKWNALASEVPTEVRVVVDGVVTDSISLSVLEGQKAVPMTAEDWENYTGTISGGIIRAYLNAEDTRITVDMSEVDFVETVELKLYSGTRLLTTSALDTEKYVAGVYGELTGAICTQGDSSAWDQTSWSPMDNVIPTEVKLFVDGVEVASAPIVVLTGVEETTLMTDSDWAKFPGTAVPPTPSTPSYTAPEEETVEETATATPTTVVANNGAENEEDEEVVIEEEETPLADGMAETTEQEEVVESTEEPVQIEDEETPLAAEADSDNASVAPALAAVAVLLLGVGSLVIIKKRNATN